MRTFSRNIPFFLFLIRFSSTFSTSNAQSNSGSIAGIVTDPSGAVIPGASVSIQNPVSAYSRTTITDSTGHFRFSNVPFNPYHLAVTKEGFGAFVEDVNVDSILPVTSNVHLKVGVTVNTVTVEGGEDLIENDPTDHTDVDRCFDRRRNLFHGDKRRWSLRLTGVNIANKWPLYNFLSTFSGTHYVTPHALTAEVGFHF